MSNDIVAKLNEWFAADEAAFIERNWGMVSQMRLGSASYAQIKREAKKVLTVGRAVGLD